MHRKVWIKAAEASNKMIFPSAHGSRGVTSMVARWNQLEGNGFGGSVIKALENRFEPVCRQVVMKLGLGS
jgi:hypothetical protein